MEKELANMKIADGGHLKKVRDQEVRQAHSSKKTRKEEREKMTSSSEPPVRHLNGSFLRNQTPAIAQGRVLQEGQDRLLRFNQRKEQCQNDKGCGYLHLPFCMFHTRNQSGEHTLRESEVDAKEGVSMAVRRSFGEVPGKVKLRGLFISGSTSRSPMFKTRALPEMSYNQET